MAVMTPSTPPPDEQGYKAERAAYLAFENDLPDTFRVFHGLELLSDEGRRGEIDFLIVHPELGLLVVECKGGGVKRDHNGQWQRWHDGSPEQMDESPWQQAEGQLRQLLPQLKDRLREVDDPEFEPIPRGGGFPYAYGTAAAFPLASAQQANLPLEADDKICFASADFDDIDSAVRQAMEFWSQRRNKSPIGQALMEAFCQKVLYPPTSLVQTMAAELRAENRQFERLSDEQLAVIRSLKHQKRLRVEGGAGTGKSLLALEAARMLADDGHRVLLTCFNRKLAESLGEKLDDVEVAHFHGLCGPAIEASEGFDFPDDDADKDQKARFWNEDAPIALFEALEAEDEPRWDAIVVDEAQDFDSSWWDALEAGLAGGSDGRLVAFLDSGQDIFDRHGEMPDMGHILPLTQNFRNTHAINEAISAFSTDHSPQPHPRAPRGEPPDIQRYNSRETERKAIGRLVRHLVTEERLSPDQLVVLTPRSRPNSVLAECEFIGGLEITDSLDESDHKLLHDSIGGFKGLERDVVIFADVDPDHPRCSPEARYVAASRARHRLYVFEKADWQGDV
jgi:hypothetical protein